jgi:tellurite resistance protein TehA-like permease
MYDITPADVVPFVAAIVAALSAMLFARHREDARPYSLVAAILYAIALGCVLLGVISWASRLMH